MPDSASYGPDASTATLKKPGGARVALYKPALRIEPASIDKPLPEGRRAAYRIASNYVIPAPVAPYIAFDGQSAHTVGKSQSRMCPRTPCMKAPAAQLSHHPDFGAVFKCRKAGRLTRAERKPTHSQSRCACTGQWSYEMIRLAFRQGVKARCLNSAVRPAETAHINPVAHAQIFYLECIWRRVGTISRTELDPLSKHGDGIIGAIDLFNGAAKLMTHPDRGCIHMGAIACGLDFDNLTDGEAVGVRLSFLEANRQVIGDLDFIAIDEDAAKSGDRANDARTAYTVLIGLLAGAANAISVAGNGFISGPAYAAPFAFIALATAWKIFEL